MSGWNEPTASDLRTMRENLRTAEQRGAVDYAAAERLRYVVDAFEDREGKAKEVDTLMTSLETAIEELEAFDVAAHREDWFGELDDLELDPRAKKVIEIAANRARALTEKAITDAVESHAQALRDALEALDGGIKE